ncbi:hypothetical protein DH2020_033653 [Rehmannia glutinosa]|uniref:Uncharacterized protein n=1 Tax=Rehmannia glutinosa TaxID=99300 RepID=A0ABR0VEJ2_REHGL
MKTRAGEDSLELYQGCILPMDQVTLGSMPDSKLEEIDARCQRSSQLDDATIIGGPVYRELGGFLARTNEEITPSNPRGKESSIGARRFCKHEALNSPSSRVAFKKLATGAKDFKDSPIFARLVVEKAAEFEVMGFYKCQSQLQKFGGFKPDFDPNKLDPELDGNRERAALDEEEESYEGQEFGFLLQIRSCSEGVPRVPIMATTVEEGDDMLDVSTLLGPS